MLTAERADTKNDVYHEITDNFEDTTADLTSSSYLPNIHSSPLVYSCIAREGIILAEYLNGDGGNVRTCVLVLLHTSKFESSENYTSRAELSGEFLMERFSINYGDEFTVHFAICDPWLTAEDLESSAYRPSPLTFLVVAERRVSLLTTFGYLQDLVGVVHKEYKEHPEIARKALHGSLQRDVNHHLEQLSDYWSSDNADLAPEVATMQGQIAGVQQVMMANLDEMIKRKDRIDILVHKTELLENDTIIYRQTASNLRRYEWFQNHKWSFYIGGIFLMFFVVVYLIERA